MFDTLLLCVTTLVFGGEAPAQPEGFAQVQPAAFGPSNDARGGQVGGMVTDGWDGAGLHATTLYFHIENASPIGTQAGQRTAMLTALQTWADLVQVHFIETPIPNRARSIDFRWEDGEHCANEPAECGDSDCVFDGPGGRFYHAAYPPGGDSLCGGIATESQAGNIHFDIEDGFSEDHGPGFNGISLALTAAHSVGHALGLRHDTVGDPGAYPSIMDNRDMRDRSLWPPSERDILFIQQGYAAGVGSVTTLETLGIWVNSSYAGTELGTPGEPFDTLAEGIAGLPPFAGTITMHMLTGLYPEAAVIDEPCIISADFGPVIIGR